MSWKGTLIRSDKSDWKDWMLAITLDARGLGGEDKWPGSENNPVRKSQPP